jgi:uncharacterized protein GlcG (DUF336 family)
MNRICAIVTIVGALLPAAAAADCANLPGETALKALLAKAQRTGGEVGGLFKGTRQWAAVVNREGEVCAVVASTSDPTQVWPGSLSIAKAKAYTANAFSIDELPLSTARLYTLTQPGHSLWGIAASNPSAPASVVSPAQGSGTASRSVQGGLISFGGGVPLYREGKIVGGLGTSGDTACADHEIAKRIRDAAGMNPPGGKGKDDITYPSIDGPSVFSHPLCQNTYRDGKFLGNEALPTFDSERTASRTAGESSTGEAGRSPKK